ncbi:MAG: hypothetical protein GYA21_13635 [Myxococcales bacterium]|nr:hypothetical protein [Myxococcales bacterium]
MSQNKHTALSGPGPQSVNRESQPAAANQQRKLGAGKFALLFWGLPFVLLIVLLATRSSCA